MNDESDEIKQTVICFLRVEIICLWETNEVIYVLSKMEHIVTRKQTFFLKNEDHTCFSENRINISTLSGNQHFLHRDIYILFMVIFSTVHLRQDRLTSTLLP